MLLLQQFQHFCFEVHLRYTEYRFQNLYDKTVRRYLFSYFYNYYFLSTNLIQIYYLLLVICLSYKKLTSSFHEFIC